MDIAKNLLLQFSYTCDLWLISPQYYHQTAMASCEFGGKWQ